MRQKPSAFGWWMEGSSEVVSLRLITPHFLQLIQQFLKVTRSIRPEMTIAFDIRLESRFIRIKALLQEIETLWNVNRIQFSYSFSKRGCKRWFSTKADLSFVVSIVPNFQIGWIKVGGVFTGIKLTDHFLSQSAVSLRS